MKKSISIFAFLLLSCSLFCQSYLQITLGGNGSGAIPEIDPNANQYTYYSYGLADASIYYTRILNTKNAVSGSLHYVSTKSEVSSNNYRWPSEYINGAYVLDSTLLHSYTSVERSMYLGLGIHSNFLLFKTFENLSIKSSLLVLFNTNSTLRVGRRESNRFVHNWEATEQIDKYNTVIPIVMTGLQYSYRLGKLLKIPIIDRIGIEISMGISYNLRNLKKDQSNFNSLSRQGSLGLNLRLGDLSDQKIKQPTGL